jgi:RAD51-like protein 2
LESILAGIHYYRVHDWVEQVALVHLLPSIIYANPKIRLVVIDSVAFHFRHDFEDMGVRTRVLQSMAQNLISLAEKYSAAVVVINQVCTNTDINIY